MRIYCLHKKHFETSKEKVQGKVLNCFVDIEKQKAVWHFTIAIRSLISKKELTSGQAITLMTTLMDLFSITSYHIDSARKVTHSLKRLETKSDNVIQLKKMGISAVEFEDHLESLRFFYYEKSLQFNQGLVIVRLLLRHYSKTEQLLSDHEKTFQRRSVAIN